ncbi:MAG: hypothetical protein JXR83_01155 [Deltaproteobacteria bacterium]|nr:hypothetical protein [Deltaproteobacteria bacterium]
MSTRPRSRYAGRNRTLWLAAIIGAGPSAAPASGQPAAESSAPSIAICVVEPEASGASSDIAGALYDMITFELEELGVKVLDPPSVATGHRGRRNLNRAWCQAAAAETPHHVLGVLRLSLSRRGSETLIGLEFSDLNGSRTAYTNSITTSDGQLPMTVLATRQLAHGLIALQSQPGAGPAAANRATGASGSAAVQKSDAARSPRGLVGTALALTGAAALAGGSVCEATAVATYQQLARLSRDLESGTYASDRAGYDQMLQRYQALWWSGLALTTLGSVAALGGAGILLYDHLLGAADGAADETE